MAKWLFVDIDHDPMMWAQELDVKPQLSSRFDRYVSYEGNVFDVRDDEIVEECEVE